MRTQLNMCASALFHVGFSSDKGWRVAGGNQTIAPKIAERLGNRVKLPEPAFLRCLVDPYAQGGSVGIGSIHHIAMAVQDDDAQRRLMRRFNDMGVGSSRIVDRFWFKSVYFRDLKGNWPEIATKGPGYTGGRVIR